MSAILRSLLVSLVVASLLLSWPAFGRLVKMKRQAIVYSTIAELVVARTSDDTEALDQLCLEDLHGRVEFSLPQLNALGRPDISSLQVERGWPKVVSVDSPEFDFRLSYVIEVRADDGQVTPHLAELTVLEKDNKRQPKASIELCRIVNNEGHVDRKDCRSSEIDVAAQPHGHCKVPKIRYRSWQSYSDDKSAG